MNHMLTYKLLEHSEFRVTLQDVRSKKREMPGVGDVTTENGCEIIP